VIDCGIVISLVKGRSLALVVWIILRWVERRVRWRILVMR
jgi:hypothetical protein